MSKQFFIHPDGTRFEVETPDPPRAPFVLSATAFQDACEAGLGSSARFGEVIRAMSTSNDDAVLAVYKRYEKSEKFDKTKAALLFSLLVSKGLMTTPERTAILAAWPEG